MRPCRIGSVIYRRHRYWHTRLMGRGFPLGYSIGPNCYPHDLRESWFNSSILAPSLFMLNTFCQVCLPLVSQIFHLWNEHIGLELSVDESYLSTTSILKDTVFKEMMPPLQVSRLLKIFELFPPLLYWWNRTQMLGSFRGHSGETQLPRLLFSPRLYLFLGLENSSQTFLLPRSSWAKLTIPFSHFLPCTHLENDIYLYVWLSSLSHSSRGCGNKQGNLDFLSGGMKTGNLHSHFFFSWYLTKKVPEPLEGNSLS